MAAVAAGIKLAGWLRRAGFDSVDRQVVLQYVSPASCWWLSNKINIKVIMILAEDITNISITLSPWKVLIFSEPGRGVRLPGSKWRW